MIQKLLKIGGVEMPSPTKYGVKLTDVDSEASGRGDTGYLTRDRIRSDVAAINVGWDMLTDNELTTIQNAIEGAAFQVEYQWKIGQYKTATMYAGDRSLELKTIDDGSMRWSLSVSLIEY